MADYYPLISRAVTGLPKKSDEARRSLYDRARKGLTSELCKRMPAPSEAELKRESHALNDAIRKVEIQLRGGLARN